MSDTGLAREVLEFWFGPLGDPGRGLPRKAWFEKNAAFDDEIRRRFGARVEAAGAGALDGLAGFPDGALALTILLDQFPRNLFRGSPGAFAFDAKARDIARLAVEKGLDRLLAPVERVFLYLPFEHSEALADQVRSVALFRSLPEVPGRDVQLDYARRHHDVIARFGRFPHRNAVLGRPSTPEELAFLREPGRVFDRRALIPPLDFLAFARISRYLTPPGGVLNKGDDTASWTRSGFAAAGRCAGRFTSAGPRTPPCR